MYFQQIFRCVYDKGSDLAGDMPFLKGKIICGLEHWRKQLFPQKWRQEGGKREAKKGGQSRWKKSRWCNGIPFLPTWSLESLPPVYAWTLKKTCELASERKPSLVLDSVVNNVFENKPYIHWHFFVFVFVCIKTLPYVFTYRTQWSTRTDA